MGKYDKLRKYLSELEISEVVLSFGSVEKLVGPLPKSARIHKAWWADDSKVEAQAWRAAGWHVASVNQVTEEVSFERDTPASVPSKKDHKWLIFVVAALTALGTAVVTLVGLAALPRWVVFIIALDISAAVIILTSAITETKYRSALLWASNACFIVLLIGIVIYHSIQDNPRPATATFVRGVTAGHTPLLYGHHYLVRLKGVYLPPDTLLWVELATPLEQVDSHQQYSYFYTQASPELSSSDEYYLFVAPNNTASYTTDVLTVFACPAGDSRVASGNGNQTLRKIESCRSLDYICIAERNRRPKYKNPPFTPSRCKGSPVGLPIAPAAG